MAIHVNEEGTIKTISDNLRPGSVFLLNLMDKTLAEIGFNHENGNSVKPNFNYITSFDLGFEPTLCILIELFVSGLSKANYTAFLPFQNVSGIIANPDTSATGQREHMFAYHGMHIYMQGASPQLNLNGFSSLYKNVIFQATTGGNSTVPYSKDVGSSIRFYFSFNLNGSSLDMYSCIGSAGLSDEFFSNNYFSFNFYNPNTSFHDTPIYLVIAV